MSDIGKQLRLSRIIRPQTRRSIGLAFDHGLHFGMMKGLENPADTIKVAGEAGIDAMILTPGILSNFGAQLLGKQTPALILRLDQTTMWRIGTLTGYDAGYTSLVTSVEDAVSMGADGVITYLFMGHSDPALERASMAITSTVASECRRWGIVHVIEPMMARHGLAENPCDVDALTLPVRVAAELGADIIKTDWTGSVESFRRIVDAALVPVLLAGGPQRAESPLDFARDALAAGAAGFLLGRQAIQSANPPETFKELVKLGHGSEIRV